MKTKNAKIFLNDNNQFFACVFKQVKPNDMVLRKFNDEDCLYCSLDAGWPKGIEDFAVVASSDEKFELPLLDTKMFLTIPGFVPKSVDLEWNEELDEPITDSKNFVNILGVYQNILNKS